MTSKRVVLLLCACVAIQASKLHRAAIKGLADEVAALLDSGLGINDIEDMVPSALGSTPLHLAVKEKHVNVVKLLIARGADLDATSDEGFTALEVALFSGAFDIAKLLWKGGADPNLVPDKRPVTMLQSAASHAHARNVVIARWLLSHGALVDKQGHNGCTALHLAAWSGSVQMVKILLANGASKALATCRGNLDALSVIRALPATDDAKEMARRRDIGVALGAKPAPLSSEHLDEL